MKKHNIYLDQFKDFCTKTVLAEDDEQKRSLIMYVKLASKLIWFEVRKNHELKHRGSFLMTAIEFYNNLSRDPEDVPKETKKVITGYVAKGVTLDHFGFVGRKSYQTLNINIPDVFNGEGVKADWHPSDWPPKKVTITVEIEN